MDPLPPPPHDHFAPIDPGGIQILDDHLFEERFEEPAFYEERRPTAQHRMSALSIHDGEVEEIRPRRDTTRIMDDRKIPQDYLYYRLTKNGEDWGRAFKTTISAPIEQIEKKAREKRGSDGTVLDQMTRMSALRRDQINHVIRSANDKETDGGQWDVVYIKSKKFLNKKKTKVEVPEMDIILARTKKQPKIRTKSTTSEFVDLQEVRDARPKKEKQYVDDSFGHARKDSGLALLSDPISNLPLFDREGRPIDAHGSGHFTGLPPQIPFDKPLGAPLDQKKEKDKYKKDEKGSKRDKSQKRSQSRDKGHGGESGIFMVPDGGFQGDAPPVDGIFGEVIPEKQDKRGRRGKSPHSRHEHPEVMIGDTGRSHSRRREGGGHGGERGRSAHHREKSRSRGDSVHFPNPHTQQYLDASSVSSETSDISHYGYEYDAESSNTSVGTHGVPRRGSMVRHEPRPEYIYKQHRRGPSGPTRHASYSEAPRYYREVPRASYHEEARYVKPARTPRDSFIVYQPRPPEARHERPRIIRQATLPAQIPEERPLLYEVPAQAVPTREVVPVQRRYSEHAPLSRYDSAPLVLHYPDEERDLYHRDTLERQSGTIENYQRDRIREEFLNDRERDVSERERDLDYRENELRRLRRDKQREYEDSRDSRRTSRVFVNPRTGQQYIYDE